MAGREQMAEVSPGVPVSDGVAEHGTLRGNRQGQADARDAPGFTWRELF